jgi:hypothetical protein
MPVGFHPAEKWRMTAAKAGKKMAGWQGCGGRGQLGVKDGEKVKVVANVPGIDTGAGESYPGKTWLNGRWLGQIQIYSGFELRRWEPGDMSKWVTL